MEDNIINWSLFLLRNIDAKVNGKTYKKHGHEWVRELYRQWLSNVDDDKKIV
jgi:hypothetical protein